MPKEPLSGEKGERHLRCLLILRIILKSANTDFRVRVKFDPAVSLPMRCLG